MAKETRLTQAFLRSTKGQYLVTWLDTGRKPIVEGNLITLKDHPDPALLWEVMAVYSTPQVHRSDIDPTWKVGGITRGHS